MSQCIHYTNLQCLKNSSDAGIRLLLQWLSQRSFVLIIHAFPPLDDASLSYLFIAVKVCLLSLTCRQPVTKSCSRWGFVVRLKCQFLILIASCDSAFAGIFFQAIQGPSHLAWTEKLRSITTKTILLPLKIPNTIVQFVRTSFPSTLSLPPPTPFTIFNFLSLSTISGQCGKPFFSDTKTWGAPCWHAVLVAGREGGVDVRTAVEWAARTPQLEPSVEMEKRGSGNGRTATDHKHGRKVKTSEPQSHLSTSPALADPVLHAEKYIQKQINDISNYIPGRTRMFGCQ